MEISFKRANFQKLCFRSTAQQNKVLLIVLNKQLTRVIKYQYQGNRGIDVDGTGCFEISSLVFEFRLLSY